MIPGGIICLFAPLVGTIAILLAGERITRRHAGIISTVSVFAAFAGALWSFVVMLGRDESARGELWLGYTWLQAGSFSVDMSILVDPLSLVMMLVVSGVGGLIILYSLGYMAGEDEERRYFAYMSFFVFAMLLLVEGGNYLILLVGWGLVGLASYLLIGFYHDRPSAVAAAKKAFVMNALGDATIALGLILLFIATGTLGFDGLLGGTSQTTLNLIALGLLGGAVAKSAQIPLQTWLPDAMEGPTPVSALIHAATMVTAGVYLICRAHPVFEAAPDIQHLAAILGAITLLVAGFIALVQQDIKRVIAYSTMSQIGYMFVGVGIGAYGAAMFHLVAHAFFKALLFLGAGIVIHHLAGEQDIRKMGGLHRQLPRTALMFLIGTLALAAIPPLAGFWSKDAILGSALAEGGTLGISLFVAGVVGSLLTGLYSFRLYLKVFRGGESDLVKEHAAHGHGHGEGPRSMLVPVAILTFFTVVGGLLNVPGAWHVFGHWLEGVAHPLVEPTTAEDYTASLFSVVFALTGIWIAWRRFVAGRELVPWSRPRLLLEHKFYFDELYDVVFYRPAVQIATLVRTRFDEPIVEGSLPLVGAGTGEAAAQVGRAQTGLLRSYAFVVAFAVAILVIVFVAVR
jgi:NADH-quinone oxidoreductase subunit L